MMMVLLVASMPGWALFAAVGFLRDLAADWIAFFFFNDAPPTEFFSLPLHDALPISRAGCRARRRDPAAARAAMTRCGRVTAPLWAGAEPGRCAHAPPALSFPAPRLFLRGRRLSRIDRKSTRLNSSHLVSRMPSSA